mgnify:CR=1 FL=1
MTFTSGSIKNSVIEREEWPGRKSLKRGRSVKDFMRKNIILTRWAVYESCRTLILVFSKISVLEEKKSRRENLPKLDSSLDVFIEIKIKLTRWPVYESC